MYTPVNPSFTIQKWGLRGSKLYRYVFEMFQSCIISNRNFVLLTNNFLRNVRVIIKDYKVGSRDQKSGVNLDNQIITLNLHISG